MSASHGSKINKLLQSLIVIIAIAVIIEFLPGAKTMLPASVSFEKSIAERITGQSLKGFFANNATPTEAAYLNSELQQKYIVTKIVDGDTIDIQNESNNSVTRVRLIGINSPESVDPRRTVECFGLEASKYIKTIAQGQEVYVQGDDSQDKYDRYDRLLAYVYLADGQMINKKMIADGYAYEYTYDKPYKYQKDFKELESFAKREGRGLWSSDTCNGLK